VRNPIRGVLWLQAYFLLAVLPLLLAFIQLDPGRGFWINFSVALGFVGLAMMGLQFVMVARARFIVWPFGIDAVLQFHRQISYVALALILTHPIILFIDDSRFVNLLNLSSDPWRAKLGIASIVFLVALISTSIFRSRLGLSYDAWQFLHAALAVAAVATALAHVLLVGYYVDQNWEWALWVVYSAVFVLIGVWVRLVKPSRAWRHPWRVVSVHQGRGGCCTFLLEPLRRDHHQPRLTSFEPGQFAWILAGRSPFAMTYHPFSISSSAENPTQIEFTVRETGDFTAFLADLDEGDPVYLDGPFGVFSIDRHPGPGFVLIGGGVGITPLLSMLRTMADRHDVRPCLVLLGNHDEDGIVLGDELEALRGSLNLEIVHVLSQPGPTWTGERGHLDADILRRHLPAEYARLEYFICGPESLMDAVEEALQKVGVPAAHVHSERFTMV
jgi:predicted ferric reductase